MIRQLVRVPARTYVRRCLATLEPKADKPLIKPPLKVDGPVGTYATALWSAAAETKQTKQVEKDSRAFLEAVKDKELANFLANPFVPKTERVRLLTPILEKLGFASTSQGLLKVLVAANRLDGAPAVFKAFLDMCKAAEGKIEGVLTTAAPLSDAEFAAVSKQVDSMTKEVLGSGSQRVALRRVVDPAVVSGLQVTFGAYQLDLTGRTHVTARLNEMVTQVLERGTALEAELQRI